MGSHAIFWYPILGMMVMGSIVGFKMTYGYSRSRPVSPMEWVTRPINAALVGGLFGFPIGFILLTVAGSGL